MNIALAKKADDAQKAYNRYVAQLRREGFAKKEQHYTDIPSDKLSETAQALRSEYQEAQDALDKEAAHPSQQELPIGGSAGKK